MVTESPMIFDKTDAKILRALEKNSKTKLSDIAEELDIGKQAVWKRIRKFQKKGMLKNFTIQLSADKCGYNFFAFIHCITKNYKQNEKKINAAIRNNPYIYAAYKVSGHSDIIMMVCDTDAKSYGNTVTQKIFGPLEPYLRSLETITAFEPIKGEYLLAAERILADALELSDEEVLSITREKSNVPDWNNIANVWDQLPDYYRPSDEMTDLTFSFVTNCNDVLITGASTLKWINKSLNFAKNITVIDIYNAFLNKTTKIYQKADNIHLKRDDARHMHFEDDSFDYILSERLIAYFTDVELKEFLNRAYNSLKKNGMLIMTCSSKGCFDDWFDFAVKQNIEVALNRDAKIINYSLMASKILPAMQKKLKIDSQLIDSFYKRVFSFHCRTSDEIVQLIEDTTNFEIIHMEEIDGGRNSFVAVRKSR